MAQKVEGLYPTVDDALEAVNRLREKGHSLSEMTLIVNEEVHAQFEAGIEENLKIETNKKIFEHSTEVSSGQIAVLIDENISLNDTNLANTQPNTIGPEGTRTYEEEQTVESENAQIDKDPELQDDELEDYERRQ